MRPKGYPQTNAFINSIFQCGWNVVSQFLCKQIKVINLSLSHHLGIKQETKNSPFNMRTRNEKVKQVRLFKEKIFNLWIYATVSEEEIESWFNILQSERSRQRRMVTRQTIWPHSVKDIGFHCLKQAKSTGKNVKEKVQYHCYKFNVNNTSVCVKCEFLVLVSFYLIFSSNHPFPSLDSWIFFFFELNIA